MSEKNDSPSKGHYETVQSVSRDNPAKLDYSTLEIDKVGLLAPSSQLAFALRALRWNYGSNPSFEVNNGILLYGHDGCGEDIVIKTVLHGCKKTYQIYADVLSLAKESRETAATVVDEIFRDAKKFKRAVIVIARADEIFRNSDSNCGSVGRAILSEIKRLGEEENQTTYVVAHVTMPWLLNADILAAFGTKIYIPFPKGKDIVEITKIYIEAIAKNNKVAVNVNDDEDIQEYYDSQNLKCVNWLELESVAYATFSKACRRTLGCSSAELFSRGKMEDLKLVEIKKGDVTASLDEIEAPFERRLVEQRFKNFIVSEGLQKYVEMVNDDEDLKPNPRKNNSFTNMLVWCFIGCFDGCC